MYSPSELGASLGRARYGCALAVAIAGGLFAAWSPGTRAEWDFGATAGALYDNNLTRAQNPSDKRAAGAATAGASATYFAPLTGGDSVSGTLFGDGQLFDRFSGLSNLAGGASAAYRHKFGLGAEAPWISTVATVYYDGYRDTLRTSTFLNLRAEIGKRFSEQFDASAAVYYERRYNDHGEPVVPGISGKVFDLSGQGVDLRAGYAPGSEWYFSMGAGVRRGDVESTSKPGLAIFLASSAIAEDPVWGDPNLYAYRLRGTTWSGALTASYALSDKASVDLVYRYGLTRAAQGLEYITNAALVTFVYKP